MKIHSILLPITMTALLAGCIGDDKDNDTNTPDPGNPGTNPPVDPGPGNANANPFLNMKSENYRLQARLDSLPAVETRNDKTVVTATITPVYRSQGENK